jgi:hypothetical protein
VYEGKYKEKSTMTQATWKLYPVREFGMFAKDWDYLNGHKLPWLTSASVQVLLKHFGGRQKLAVYASDVGVCAMAILERTGLSSWQTWQPSQCPTALWVQPFDANFEGLVDGLRQKLGVYVLGVTQVDPDMYVRPAGSMDYIETARITVGGTFEEYWAGRGKNLRQDLPNQLRKLEREGIPGRLVISRDPDCVDQYGGIESKGWKGATAVSPDNAQGRFYKEWIPAIGGFTALYYFGNRLAACDLCVEKDCQLTILKTTHNEEIKGYSAAHLLRYELFKQRWSELHRIEFFGRVSWHTKWTDEVRKMYHFNSYWCEWPRALFGLLKKPHEVISRPSS